MNIVVISLNVNKIKEVFVWNKKGNINMDKYVNRLGEFVELPRDAVKVSDCITGISEKFRVDVFKDDAFEEILNYQYSEPKRVGYEIFRQYPEKNQIMWAICKHKGNIANVTKYYELEYDE